MTSFSHDTWLSPFTWRYGSAEMKALWSLYHQRRIWRRIWVALADAQRQVGLVTQEQVDDLRAHVDDVDLERAEQIEAEIRHDVMAEVKTYAEQCQKGAGIIHLGATSMDVQDNADAIRLQEALDLVIERLCTLANAMVEQIEAHADAPTMAFTHLQPAEPTTTGYRLAQTGQDLRSDLLALKRCRDELVGKGFKGAAGTSASYAQLLEGTGVDTVAFEAMVMQPLGIRPADVATQTVPRKQEFVLVSTLASLGQTLYRFAFDLRVLQSPVIGEWSEPFGKKQVGSSAMPFKRNPIGAENIDSLARHLAALPRVLWDNAAHSLLERTLDDSGNRRSVLPEAFLITDQLLLGATRLVGNLTVDRAASAALMDTYGPFASTERLLMEAVKRGGNRQELHEVIRDHSLTAWAAIRAGKPNRLTTSLADDPTFIGLMRRDEVLSTLVAEDYLGDAPRRARELATSLKTTIEECSP